MLICTNVRTTTFHFFKKKKSDIPMPSDKSSWFSNKVVEILIFIFGSCICCCGSHAFIYFLNGLNVACNEDIDTRSFLILQQILFLCVFIAAVALHFTRDWKIIFFLNL